MIRARKPTPTEVAAARTVLALASIARRLAITLASVVFVFAAAFLTGRFWWLVATTRPETWTRTPSQMGLYDDATAGVGFVMSVVLAGIVLGVLLVAYLRFRCWLDWAAAAWPAEEEDLRALSEEELARCDPQWRPGEVQWHPNES